MSRGVEQVTRGWSPAEEFNFLLTNRIPRRALTRLIGWYSQIESRWLTRLSISVWSAFADDLRLHEAANRDFRSLRDCFTRRLRPDARPVDRRAHIAVSPCDAEIGEFGPVEGDTAFQAKGFPYQLDELIPDPEIRSRFRDGYFVNLRLKSSMYHRFHAPVDCRIDAIDYVSGDAWNVNPPTLKRIEKLYCRNERAVIPLGNISTRGELCLVAVAAVLVASMRFEGLDQTLDLRYRGPNRIDMGRDYVRGQEIGHFQQGSTILIFATRNYRLRKRLVSGDIVRMGQPLLIDTTSLTKAVDEETL
ncbi:MAG: phosphatidylserine decarboxylase [Chromatiales bacterium]|nr:phosphatidylserine decarboxylase [Chromatiales bacterium]